MNYKKKFSGMCKRCIRGNGFCIKDVPYIGLCALNDRKELIEIWMRRRNKNSL